MIEHLAQEPADSVAFIERLVAAVPGLTPRYERLLGELRADGINRHGAEFLLSEYTRALVEELPASRGALAELAAFMEREYGVSADVDSPIENSFVLHVTDRTPAGDPAEVLGPKLRPLVDKERSWRASPAGQALVDRMVQEIPALTPIADDNRYGDHQDVLVHMFLGEVVQREVENAEAGRLEEPRAVAELLESLFEAGELVPGAGDADEAIGVSYVENMPYPGESGQALIGLLGPKLRAELERQRGPRGT